MQWLGTCVAVLAFRVLTAVDPMRLDLDHLTKLGRGEAPKRDEHENEYETDKRDGKEGRRREATKRNEESCENDQPRIDSLR